MSAIARQIHLALSSDRYLPRSEKQRLVRLPRGALHPRGHKELPQPQTQLNPKREGPELPSRDVIPLTPQLTKEAAKVCLSL